MLTDNQITQERTNQKLTPEFLERILNNASARDLIEIVKCFKDENAQDSGSHAGADSLKISPKTAKELNGFFNKIAENLDKIFYKDCQTDRFLTSFYKDIESATNRLRSGRDLRPEQRLELQPSAYSGFDDKFSQQDFANILFVIAIANYASNKSQGEIEEDRFINVLQLMEEKSAKQKEELLREPRFQVVIPHRNALISSTYVLNSIEVFAQLALFSHEFYKNTNDFETTSGMHKIIVPSLGIAESLSRIVVDHVFLYSLHNNNTRFLLFTTSLLFCLESLVEIASNKNLFKTFINSDQPTSVDNTLLVDTLRVGLFIASQFDSRFRINRVSNNIVNSFSSLYRGVINCAKSLSKSREPDLESGQQLMENETTISPDQIKKLAKAFDEFLSTHGDSLNSFLPPNTNVRISGSNLDNKSSSQQHI